MFFSGNPTQGVCPAGQSHDASPSGDYAIVFDDGLSFPVGQENWRWYHKCQGLFFAGHLTQGVCPAGQSHDGSQSGAYLIEFASDAVIQ